MRSMTTRKTILWGLLGILAMLVACTPTGPARKYSPYYLVTIPANASPTRTPFRPPAATQAPQISETPLASPTLPPLPITSTPMPTTTLAPTPAPTLAMGITPGSMLNLPEVSTFLLMGSDLRRGSSYRTDTLVIAIVRPKEAQVALISIPRDLWVNIPTVGLQRINTAYQYGEINGYQGGGAGLVKDTLLQNLGIKIDHTALVDFDGFRKIVDTLGGVDVPIACAYTDWHLIAPDLDPENEDNWALFTAGPGLIHMDGDLALWYARSRQKSNDFDRGRRQQEVLRAIYRQALRSELLSQLPQLYEDFQSSVLTDFGLPDALAMAPITLNMSNADIRSYYIAGDLVTPWITPGGAYVLLPNVEAIQSMFQTAMSPSPIQEARQTIRVEIQNGSNMDGWDALAAERLGYAGFETSLKPASHRNHATTLLYDLSEEQQPGQRAALQAILGLPDHALIALPDPNAEVEYVLVIGDDYQPCFNPNELSH